MARVPDAVPQVEAALGDLNIFKALANSPQVLKGFNNLGRRLLFRGALPARTRELVVLRIGAMLGSDYEWGQHVLMGRAAGLSDDEIRAIREGRVDGLSESEAAAVRYGEAVEERRVDDALWEQTAKHFSAGEMVELTVLAGYYGLVSRALLALGVELDDNVQGLDHP